MYVYDQSWKQGVSGNKQGKSRTYYTIINFRWDLATNFQTASNWSTPRSSAVQILNKCLSSLDVSLGNLQRTCFHEDDFTKTFSSLANSVKSFFHHVKLPHYLSKQEPVEQYSLNPVGDILRETIRGWLGGDTAAVREVRAYSFPSLRRLTWHRR